MGHKIAGRTRLAMCIAALCMTSVSAVQAADLCSTAAAAGEWGLKSTSTFITPVGPVPAATVSRVSVDAAGNITGIFFGNAGGQFVTWTVAGTWAVNSDCTATVSVKFYQSGVLVQTAQFSTVFVQNSQEFFGVEQSATVPPNTPFPVVTSVDGKRLSFNNSNQQ